jgi:hypothetical protein
MDATELPSHATHITNHVFNMRRLCVETQASYFASNIQPDHEGVAEVGEEGGVCDEQEHLEG